MPTIIVRNIPGETYEKLKRAAQLNHRSINSEIIACVERVVCSHEVNADLLLANARRLREKTAFHPMMDKASARARTTGRL